MDMLQTHKLMRTIEGFPWLQHMYLIDYVHYTVVVAAYKAYVSDLLFFLFVGLSLILEANGHVSFGDIMSAFLNFN
jgi:hypothetical protein